MEEKLSGWQTVTLAGVLGFSTDYVWAESVRAVSEGNAFAAATLGLLLFIAGCYSMEMVKREDYAALSAFGVAGWLGTYLSVIR